MANFVVASTLIHFLLLLTIGTRCQMAEYHHTNDHRKSSELNRIYVGSYNEANEVGITAFDRMDDSQFKEVNSLVTRNSAFLIMDGTQRFIYAANELHGNTTGEIGKITAYSIVDPSTGQLTILNWLDAQGSSPAYLSLDPSGKFVLSANYGSGRVVVMSLNANGSLNSIVDVEESPEGNPNTTHAHMVAFHPTQTDVVAVAFLGLDRVYFYAFDENTGALKPYLVPGKDSSSYQLYAQLLQGTGPRHFTFSEDGQIMYVVGETASTLTVFNTILDENTGSLTGFQSLQSISTLPSNFTGTSSGAEIALHLSGEFLYTSNRGHDSIAVFSVDQDSGLATPIEYVPTGGQTPRYFTLTPDGLQLIVANQNSDTVVVFDIDAAKGTLTNLYTIAESVQQPAFILYQDAIDLVDARQHQGTGRPRWSYR